MTPLEHAEQIKRLAGTYAETCVSYDNNDCSYPAVKDDLDVLHTAIESLAQRCAEAEQKLAEAEADAARYRAFWQFGDEFCFMGQTCRSKAELDATIDQAMGSKR